MLRRLVLATLICIALLTVACIGGGRGYDSARRVISSALADEAGNTYVAYRAERSPGDHDIHVLKGASSGIRRCLPAITGALAFWAL